MTERPDRTEAAEYHFKYIDQVALPPGGSIADALESQLDDHLELFANISEDQAGHRYAPDKWSLRQVLSHVNDTERLFAFRALWFARELGEPLPSFDENVAARAAGADDRSWKSHVDEFRAVRAASLALFRHLPDATWMRRGTASGKPFTVRAVAFIIAGHAAHHVALVRERYLVS